MPAAVSVIRPGKYALLRRHGRNNARDERREVTPLGADGAVTWDGETLHRVAAKPVEAVNTNGAGDMFAGAYLYALSRGESDLRATEYATLAAGEVVKYFGPRLERDACLALRRQFFGD